ncbi:lanthionine synthetase LanC family protein [Kribbella sp. NPDC026611]|uniref:lanthionine synthetase LanC family protein n=1 Tax=Kribbella sp. NPDC026611 TaxID=3154911 RepID=UPI0033F4710E
MRYGELGEAAWAWVLGQVRWDDDGPWIPEAGGGEKPDEYLNGMHSGIGGLAHVLTELRLTRPLTSGEEQLAGAIADRIRGSIPADPSISFFDGLASSIGVLTALGEPGSGSAVQRALDIAIVDGWNESTFQNETRYHPGAVGNDVTLGNGSGLIGALWALRHGVDARELAERSADWVLMQKVTTEAGLTWPFVSQCFRQDEGIDMPNFSHGLAGTAAVLAVAGVELERPELIEAARLGAEQLVTLGINDDKGFRVPRVIPWAERHGDEYTYNWCHGGAGTALLFSALEYAEVPRVAGEPTKLWRRRCLDGVRYSGIPERLHPGFWDNDGRCCGTAGAGDAFLDAWQRDGDKDDLEFAVRLGDALVDRAYRENDHAYWRFVEHRNDDPLLPPGVGWMQGAAGIAAYLLRLDRVLGGDERAVARMDNWWAVTP